MFLEPKPDRFETTCGLLLAIFASFLAASQIMDDNFGAEELKAVNEKSQSYQWHQAKGIKQNLVEGQIGLFETLIKSNSIAAKDTAAIYGNLAKLKTKVARYEKEKDEILNGSAAVGNENWVQDIEGEMAKVVGARQWEKTIEYYNMKGDQMAFTSMILQIGIVMGGLSLILQGKNHKLTFFYIMLTLGGIGFVYGGISLFADRAAQQLLGLG